MRRFRLPAVFSLAAALLICSTAVADDSKPKIAILGLEVIQSGSDIDPETVEVAQNVVKALRSRPLAGRGPYVKAPGSDKDLLEMKFLVSCNDEGPACMAKIGRQLGADRLMYGKIEQRKDGYRVGIKLLDVDKRKVMRAVTDQIAFDDAEPALVQKLSRRLYNRLTGQSTGKLVITADVPDGAVYVNGAQRGYLEDGELLIDDVEEGRYMIRVEAEGRKPYEIEVDVSEGETLSVEAKLDGSDVVARSPESPSGRPGGTWRIATWVLVAGATVSGVLAITNYQTLQDLNGDNTDIVAFQNVSGLDLGSAPCDSARAIGPFDPFGQQELLHVVLDNCDRADSAAIQANLFAGITLVTAVAAGFAFYKGYLSAGSESKSRGARGAQDTGKATVHIVPAITPNHVGAGLKIEF